MKVLLHEGRRAGTIVEMEPKHAWPLINAGRAAQCEPEKTAEPATEPATDTKQKRGR